MVRIKIPKDELDLAFSRSSGPGGQNVNKLNTKVEIRFHVESASWLPLEVKQRLLEQQENRINKKGELVVTSQETRFQSRNIADCLQKVQEIVDLACIKPKERKIKEGLSEFTKKKRVVDKRIHSEKKARRRGEF